MFDIVSSMFTEQVTEFSSILMQNHLKPPVNSTLYNTGNAQLLIFICVSNKSEAKFSFRILSLTSFVQHPKASEAALWVPLLLHSSAFHMNFKKFDTNSQQNRNCKNSCKYYNSKPLMPTDMRMRFVIRFQNQGSQILSFDCVTYLYQYVFLHHTIIHFNILNNILY